MGLFGVAIVVGLGLASYAESGAFSFYKQQRPVEWADQQAAGPPAPALTQMPTSPNPSSVQYRDWTPAASGDVDPQIVELPIESEDYVTWTDDSLPAGADLQPVSDMPHAEPEPRSSQIAMATSAQEDGSVPSERQSAAPVDESRRLGSPADEPLEGIEDPQN